MNWHLAMAIFDDFAFCFWCYMLWRTKRTQRRSEEVARELVRRVEASESIVDRLQRCSWKFGDMPAIVTVTQDADGTICLDADITPHSARVPMERVH